MTYPTTRRRAHADQEQPRPDRRLHARPEAACRPSCAAAARIAGTPSRNENRAAASRRSPRNIPVVIVAPDRETPGTSAAACATPMANASAGVDGPFAARRAVRPAPPAGTAAATATSVTDGHPRRPQGVLDRPGQQQAGDDDRHRADGDQPQAPARRVGRPHGPAEQAGHGAAPGRPGQSGSTRRRPAACRRGTPRRRRGRTRPRPSRAAPGPGSGGPNSTPAGTRSAPARRRAAPPESTSTGSGYAPRRRGSFRLFDFRAPPAPRVGRGRRRHPGLLALAAEDDRDRRGDEHRRVGAADDADEHREREALAAPRRRTGRARAPPGTSCRP